MVAPRLFNQSMSKKLLRLQNLSLGKDANVMSSPPAVTLSAANAASSIASAVSIAYNDSAITFPGINLVNNTGAGGYYTAGNIALGGSGPCNVFRVRFLTDAPVFEIRTNAAAAQGVMIMVDGEYVTRGNSVMLPNDSTGRNIKVDFGSDAPYYAAVAESMSVTSGGSGYAVGDEITVAGGTFTTAAVLTVTKVSAGVVQGVAVKTAGNYSVLPSNPAGQASTTGSGSGVAFTMVWQQKHSTTKFRRIEIFGGSYFRFFGLYVGPNDTVKKWQVHGPRGMFVGDSITADQRVDFPGGSYGSLVSRLIGIDDAWQSGVHGTGYLATYSGGVKLRDRISTDITPFSPDLIFCGMGYNDNAQVAANLQAEVTACWQQIYAENPNAYFICTQGFRGNTTIPSDAIAQAIRDGFAASGIPSSQGQFLPSITEKWASARTTSTENPHPGQYGHDQIAAVAAPRILDAIAAFG